MGKLLLALQNWTILSLALQSLLPVGVRIVLVAEKSSIQDLHQVSMGIKTKSELLRINVWVAAKFKFYIKMQLKSVRPLLYWGPLPNNNYLQVYASDTFGVPRNILGSDKWRNDCRSCKCNLENYQITILFNFFDGLNGKTHNLYVSAAALY